MLREALCNRRMLRMPKAGVEVSHDYRNGYDSMPHAEA